MESIYVHISPDKLPFSSNFNLNGYTFGRIPDYANYSFEQSEKFLGTKPTILQNDYLYDTMMPEIVDFFNYSKHHFPSHTHDAFWFTTLVRLMVVSNYCDRYSIDNFIHLEYDNLIYSDMKMLEELPKNLYFTRVGKHFSSAGFTFCNDIEKFKSFLHFIRTLIGKGEDLVRTVLPYHTISEMNMIDLMDQQIKGVFDYLPILPDGIGSENFDKLNVLFDGASYGQYIGGTNNGQGSGWFGNHHYVGNAISNGKIKILFENGYPYVIINEEKIDIMNLHIHSKELSKYV